MRALCLLREALHYRRNAFCSGLKRAGYEVVRDLHDPKPGDLLVIWNRFGHGHELAQQFERCGATVLVVENGWLGKEWRGGEWFTLCIGHHAGAGTWGEHGPSRWDGWRVELMPWQEGSRTLILGQRGIGEPGIASPPQWAEQTQRRIGGMIRPHPGKRGQGIVFADVGKVVTWASGAAIKALAAGVPVWHDFQQWIGAEAASRIGEPLVRDDGKRLAMFRRMAWSMWTLDEIQTGDPIRCVIG